MRNLLLASMFFVSTLLLTSCGVESSVVTPITLSVGAGTGSEGDNVTFTVSLSETSTEATTFKYRTDISTADTAEQADFTAIGAVGSERDGTISIGKRTTTIEVITADDNEGDDETFSLVLSDVSGAFFSPAGTTLTAIGTITDNDPPALSVGAGTGSETTEEVVFTVSLSSAAVNDITFKYRTEIGTDDTAQPEDFTTIGAVGTEIDGMIVAGNTTLDVVVVITDDTKDDDDETFSLVLSAVSGAVFAGDEATLTATGTITDNDLPPPMLGVGVARGDEGGSVTFAVSLSEILTEAVTFKYRTEVVTGNTAQPADFTAIGAVGSEMDGMIAAGDTTLNVVVSINENTSKDGDKTFSLVLSDVSGVVFAGDEATFTATGIITDNEVVDANNNRLIDIATVAELSNIRYSLAGTSYKTSSTDRGNSIGCPAGGCNGYELIGNIDLALVSNWLPIQGQADTSIKTWSVCVNDNSGIWDGAGCLFPAAYFSAIFDGKDNTISNFTINGNSNLLGLFGVVSGTLKNLKLREGSMTGLDKFNPNTAGALAGYLTSDGIIESSSSNLAVKLVGIGDNVGGLVGINYGIIQDSNASGTFFGGERNYNKLGCLVGTNYGTVQNSTAACAVTVSRGEFNYIGGLVGYNVSIVQNSGASSVVKFVGDGEYGNAGGLVGRNIGTIRESYATGDVTGEITGDVTGEDRSRNRLGGLVGRNDGIIEDSNATGEITGSTGKFNYLGGLVGMNWEGGITRNSSASGDVIGLDHEFERAGGLIGRNDGTIRDSYATGDVYGGAGFGDSVGGLVGLLLSIASTGTIRDSYATGDVYGGAGDNFVGGLVGWVYGNSKIINSYATGNANGDDGDDRVGGLVGRNEGRIENSYASGVIKCGTGTCFAGGLIGLTSYNSEIWNSYAIGAVTGGDVGGNKLGGLMGQSSGSVYNSYATGAVTGGDGDEDFVGGLVGNSDDYSTILRSYALGAVIGGGDNDNVGRITGFTNDTDYLFGNYYSNESTFEGENERAALSSEEVGRTVVQLKALTATIIDSDFTGYSNVWDAKSWDFTAEKYPSLKSYKVDENGAQVDGDLLCGQGTTDWVQCPSP